MEPYEIPADPLPKPRGVARLAMLLLAYASVLGVLLLLGPEPPHFGGHTYVSVAGLPPRMLMALVAGPLALTGTIWMHRILREGSEPESNDHHWWSRA
jgi:hypothetical protein